MEVCGPCNPLDPHNISRNNEHFMDPFNLKPNDSSDFSPNDLETHMTEFFHIKDTKISTSCFDQYPGKNGIANVTREDEQNYFIKKNRCSSASEKCFSKYATFPPLGDPKPSEDGFLVGKKKQESEISAEVSKANDHGKSVTQFYSRSMSPPTPSKLVSAMKGSREKQGIEPKKLSVTWAPDVYDPVPTAASHVPSNKNQRHYSDSKKYGKNKQKGGVKSSRANKGKDKKKQVRRTSGGNMKLKPLHDDGGMMIGFCKPVMSIVDLNVGSHDPFCGSSFLKKSISRLHFPVAEAT